MDTYIYMYIHNSHFLPTSSTDAKRPWSALRNWALKLPNSNSASDSAARGTDEN